MKHLVKRFGLATALVLGGMMVHAQETWSLERCIQYALDNNISIKQADANVRTALLSEQQAKANRLPSVSGSASLGEQFGRTIDPTTNTFSTQGIGYNSFGLNAGINVFNGGLIHHSVKQAKLNAQASSADAEQTRANLALQIASAYLTILLTQEQLENAGKRVDQSQRQLANTLKLIEAGTLPQADRYNLEAQIARDQQSQITVQNNLDLAFLSLKQLLLLEPDFDLKVEKPLVDIPADANPGGFTLSNLYQTAQQTQSGVRAATFRVQGAHEGIAVAKSAYYPTLSIFANLSSNYSSQFFERVSTGNIVKGDPIQVDINGSPILVSFYNEESFLRKLPYFTQLDRNFGQGFGINMNIPIYQNGRTRLSVERARLNVISAQLQENSVKQQLKNDIQTAIANARAGQKQLEAARKSVEATRIAFTNMEKRHQLGAVNTLDLTTAKNNLDIAENDLLLAKYDYLFRLKILDFYQGKNLKLD
jgi:outer membrane protein